MCGVVSALFGLLEVGVQLDLVDTGGHCGGTNQHIDVTGQEVADADMPDQSVTLCVDKSLPCLDVEALGRIGPVDQIQVEIIESEPAQAFLDADAGLVVLVEASGQLRGDDDVVTRHRCHANRFADRALVLIVHCGVEQSVTVLQGRGNGLRAGESAYLVGAESHGGKRKPIMSGADRQWRGGRGGGIVAHSVPLMWNLTSVDIADGWHGV